MARLPIGWESTGATELVSGGLQYETVRSFISPVSDRRKRPIVGSGLCPIILGDLRYLLARKGGTV